MDDADIAEERARLALEADVMKTAISNRTNLLEEIINDSVQGFIDARLGTDLFVFN